MRSCSAREDVRFGFERNIFRGQFDFYGVKAAFDGFFEGETEVVANFFCWVDCERRWVRGGIGDVSGRGDCLSGLQDDGCGDAEVGFEVEADGFFSLVDNVSGEVDAR